MANNLQITITAQNRASPVISRVTQQLQRMRAPQFGSSITRMSNQFARAFTSPGGATTAISSFLTSRNLLVGAIAGVIVQTMRMESQWASSVRAMSNMATRTGLTTPQAYQTQYAGRLAGLSDEQANQGIETLRQTYSDAMNNRNVEAMKRYQAAGISTDPTRPESTESILTKLAAYGEKLRAAGQYGGAQNFYQAAGAGQLTDMLNRGPDRVAAYMREAKKYVPNDEDIRRANEYADASARLGVTYDRLRNTILGQLEPGANTLLVGLQNLLDGKRIDAGLNAPEHTNNYGRSLIDGAEMFGNALRGRGALTNAEVAATPGANTPGLEGWRTGAGNITPESRQLFASLEQKYQLPSGLLDAVWAQESSRGVHMRSPEGAEGHFGFMPKTAKQYGLDDPNDLAKSADASAHYYRDLLRQNNGNLPRALAAYNWGPGNLQRKGLGRAPAETRGYIADVMSNMAESNRVPVTTRAALPSTDTVIDADTGAETREAAPSIYGDTGKQGAGGSGQAAPPQKMQIDITHRNAPPGTSVNVSAPESVNARVKSERRAGAMGNQYAYSPSNF